MKLLASTSEGIFFKFTLSEEWFEGQYDYKKIKGVTIESVSADVSEDFVEVVEDPEADCKVSLTSVVYEEDDFDRFVKVFCDVEINISDERFASLPDAAKGILKTENLNVFVDGDNTFEVHLGEFIYDGDEAPELDEHYFYISPAEQAIMNDPL